MVGLAIKLGLLAALVAASVCAPAWADLPGAAAARSVAEKGVAYIRANVPDKKIGETALAGLALVKAGVPVGDPAVRACVNKVITTFDQTGYVNSRTGGHGVYEAAVVGLFLVGLDPDLYRRQIMDVGRFLLDAQNPNGSWDYYPTRRTGDTSITQFAVLALWELNQAGLDVAPAVWERVIQWHLDSQHQNGGFRYHPRDEFDDIQHKRNFVRLSLTAGAMGSLLICHRQLRPPAAPAGRGVHRRQPLLAEKKAETPEDISAERLARVAPVVARARQFLVTHLMFTAQAAERKDPLTIEQGPAYYWLYSLERCCALAGLKDLNGVDWYSAGTQFLEVEQRPDGSWQSKHGDLVGTSFAVLFLCRAALQTLRKAQPAGRYRRGSLLAGGRGMPGAVEADQGGVASGWYRPYTSPLKGTVDDLLILLAKDDPELDVDAVMAGLMVLVDKEGYAVLAERAEQLDALARHARPDVRRTTLWLMARSRDLRFAPALIRALADPDAQVYGAARDGLRFLSRRLDGFGLPNAPTDAQRRTGASRWRQWYEGVRPDVPLGSPDEKPSPAGAGAAAPAKD